MRSSADLPRGFLNKPFFGSKAASGHELRCFSEIPARAAYQQPATEGNKMSLNNSSHDL
jgi:hypothetical protein